MCLLFIFAVLLESLVVKVIYSRSYKSTEHINLVNTQIRYTHSRKHGCWVYVINVSVVKETNKERTGLIDKFLSLNLKQDSEVKEQIKKEFYNLKYHKTFTTMYF